MRVADHMQLLWGISELVVADLLLGSPIGHRGAEPWLALQPTTPTVAHQQQAHGSSVVLVILGQLGEMSRNCGNGLAIKQRRN